jgi:hypothetical protein
MAKGTFSSCSELIVHGRCRITTVKEIIEASPLLLISDAVVQLV